MSLDLARALAPADTPGTVVSAAVTDVKADGTVTIDLGGGRVVPDCAVLATYSPAPGDLVEAMRRDATTFLVLGVTRVSAPTTVDVSDSLAAVWTVHPAYGEAAASGTKIVTATNTQSYRSSDKWERDDVYQGAYSSTVSLGYFRGCYFYGSGFSSLVGKRCTAVSIRISRKSAGGIGGAEGVYIAPHAHASQPSGSPVWRAGATKVGTLAWGGVATFALPVSWGQGLIDGTIKGFGHLRDSSSDYAVFDSLAADSLSGRVSLTWTD